MAHQDIDLDCKEFIIAHGKSTWAKPEKVAKMERESTGGQPVLDCSAVHTVRNPRPLYEVVLGASSLPQPFGFERWVH